MSDFSLVKRRIPKQAGLFSFARQVWQLFERTITCSCKVSKCQGTESSCQRPMCPQAEFGPSRKCWRLAPGACVLERQTEVGASKVQVLVTGQNSGGGVGWRWIIGLTALRTSSSLWLIPIATLCSVASRRALGWPAGIGCGSDSRER
jgi:hypothetical protein